MTSHAPVSPRPLVEPVGVPDLTPQRERLLELGLDLPRLRAPVLVQHRVQDAVDAEPGMPEASVGVVHSAFGPRVHAYRGAPRGPARAFPGPPCPGFADLVRITYCASRALDKVDVRAYHPRTKGLVISGFSGKRRPR